MNSAKKIAVVLFNIGGPDRAENIRPFLFNFFRDKNIINLPNPLRWFLARMISNRRSKGEALEAYDMLGGKSPLLENTEKQAQALEKTLSKKNSAVFKTFVSMRYWHPMSDDVAMQVKDFDPDKMILLPLYPQYSTTTSNSSLGDWGRAMRKANMDIPSLSICCYHKNPGFIKASAMAIKKAYDAALNQNPDINYRVLFSAHGLPEKIVQGGDPYQWQCEQTAKEIASATGIENLDWAICYQSRVGPLKWIGPSTEEALEKAAADKKGILIYPHAFVSEHVETLVEIDIEYRHMAEELGVLDFVKVPTVGDDAEFINSLSQIILDRLDDTGVVSNDNKRVCPENFKCCAMRQTEFQKNLQADNSAGE